jgi:hypothetical protein
MPLTGEVEPRVDREGRAERVIQRIAALQRDEGRVRRCGLLQHVRNRWDVPRHQSFETNIPGKRIHADRWQILEVGKT